mmetsp:Transcript_20822/g.32127  ORF Transcript_20822/g.32127 Transcript_20822/m.32127 type:complete len:130 (-) Transcript_20822:529-918(-)
MENVPNCKEELAFLAFKFRYSFSASLAHLQLVFKIRPDAIVFNIFFISECALYLGELLLDHLELLHFKLRVLPMLLLNSGSDFFSLHEFVFFLSLEGDSEEDLEQLSVSEDMLLRHLLEVPSERTAVDR